MTVKIEQGDCPEVLKIMPDNSVDSIVTDPPYGISFMGKKWDYDIPSVDVWREALRVLKPGGHALIACGTRTQHRMACAIEDAGFEIRDTVAWIYGSGFPKSLNIGKAVDKLQGNDREIVGKSDRHAGQSYQWAGEIKHPTHSEDKCVKTKGNSPHEGWGTALKPAMELWTLCRKPLSEPTVAANVLKWGTGGINVDGCRVTMKGENPTAIRRSYGFTPNLGKARDSEAKGKIKDRSDPEKKAAPNESDNLGRFPANLIHDGSDEVLRGFPETGNGNSASRFFYCAKGSRSERNAGLEGMESKEKKTLQPPTKQFVDYDGQKHDTNGDKRYLPRQNHHPTVKPIALMEYLVRLTKTPTGGIVLDPFMGSGTTGIACVNEGREFIGIEQSPEYMEIARRRIEYAMKNLQPRLL